MSEQVDKIYAVASGHYEQYGILTVWLDPELAEANAKQWGDAWVEEYEVLHELPTMMPYHSRAATVCADGSVEPILFENHELFSNQITEDAKRTGIEEAITTDSGVKRPEHPEYGGLFIQVDGPSREKVEREYERRLIEAKRELSNRVDD